MKQLDSTARALLTGKPADYSATVVRWLGSDSLAHFIAVRDLCTGFGEDAPRFDLDFSGLPRPLAERISKRCCALLMVFPETIASISLKPDADGTSRRRPADRATALRSAPHHVLERPARLSGIGRPGRSGADGEAIGRAIERLDRYIVAVEAARDLAELRPSQHHRFLVETKRREERIAISKTAQRQSIFADIFRLRSFSTAMPRSSTCMWSLARWCAKRPQCKLMSLRTKSRG